MRNTLDHRLTGVDADQVILNRATPWNEEAFDGEGRRAVLHESVLVRLLSAREEREESRWGLLVSACESMARWMGMFLEDISASADSGALLDPTSARYVLLEARRLKDGTFVSLIHCQTDQATRELAFAGFNTPCSPRCSSVRLRWPRAATFTGIAGTSSTTTWCGIP